MPRFTVTIVLEYEARDMGEVWEQVLAEYGSGAGLELLERSEIAEVEGSDDGGEV